MGYRAVFATALFCLFTAVRADSASAESLTSSFTLSNGMHWIVLERPGSGRVWTNLYVDVGTVFEVPGKTGVSQMVAALQRSMAGAAGFPTARTWVNHDHQCFLGNVPTAEVGRWLRFQAGLMTRLDTSPLETVRKAQLTEIEKRTSHGAWLLDEVQRVAFLTHPYGQPRWGYPSDVEQLSREDVEAFWRTYYVPANTIAVVTGDVSLATVREVAEAAFGGLPAGVKAGWMRAAEPRQRTERRVLAPPEGDGAVAIAFHKGAVRDTSYALWDVLMPAAGARLKAKLEAQCRRVDASFSPAMKYPGLAMVLAFLKPGVDADAVVRTIQSELEELGRTPLGAEEMAAARKAFAGPPGGLSDECMAVELGDWQAMTGDYRTMFGHRGRVNAATAEQVRALAAETFRLDGRTVGIAPGTAKPVLPQ